jgi:hypothetical protein
MLTQTGNKHVCNHITASNIHIMCRELLKAKTCLSSLVLTSYLQARDVLTLQELVKLKRVNQLIFVMVKCGVLFEVRTEFLNNI